MTAMPVSTNWEMIESMISALIVEYLLDRSETTLSATWSPFKPCVRFSRTRLTDDVLRLHAKLRGNGSYRAVGRGRSRAPSAGASVLCATGSAAGCGRDPGDSDDDAGARSDSRSRTDRRSKNAERRSPCGSSCTTPAGSGSAPRSRRGGPPSGPSVASSSPVGSVPGAPLSPSTAASGRGRSCP